MKVIFLDIDGVLNSSDYFIKEGTAREARGESRFVPCGIDHLDPAAIKFMNLLVERSDANIVISSTWRRIYSITEIREMLYKRGATFTTRIIGKTTTELQSKRFSESVRRGNEIQHWIDGHIPTVRHDKVESFVILDDDSDMEHLSYRLVQTDYVTGLTLGDVEKALEVLRRPLVV